MGPPKGFGFQSNDQTAAFNAGWNPNNELSNQDSNYGSGSYTGEDV